MDEREIWDSMYSLFAKTTQAESAFWMPEEIVNVPGKFKIYAVSQGEDGQDKKLIGSFLSDEDADFMTAIHGAFPDLFRRALEAFDEADNLDHERDSLVCRIAELEAQVDEQAAVIARQESDLEKLDIDYMSAKTEAEHWKEQAGE